MQGHGSLLAIASSSESMMESGRGSFRVTGSATGPAARGLPLLRAWSGGSNPNSAGARGCLRPAPKVRQRRTELLKLFSNQRRMPANGLARSIVFMVAGLSSFLRDRPTAVATQLNAPNERLIGVSRCST